MATAGKSDFSEDEEWAYEEATRGKRSPKLKPDEMIVLAEYGSPTGYKTIIRTYRTWGGVARECARYYREYNLNKGDRDRLPSVGRAKEGTWAVAVGGAHPFQSVGFPPVIRRDGARIGFYPTEEEAEEYIRGYRHGWDRPSDGHGQKPYEPGMPLGEAGLVGYQHGRQDSVYDEALEGSVRYIRAPDIKLVQVKHGKPAPKRASSER